MFICSVREGLKTGELVVKDYQGDEIAQGLQVSVEEVLDL